MSRPFRLFPFLLLLLALATAGCKTSTPYKTRYSSRKNYFVAPPEKLSKSAEDLIKETEAPAPGTPPPGVPPPPGIPGFPGDAAPAAPAPSPIPGLDPLAPAPAAPAPAAPALEAPAPAPAPPVAPPL